LGGRRVRLSGAQPLIRVQRRLLAVFVLCSGSHDSIFMQWAKKFLVRGSLRCSVDFDRMRTGAAAMAAPRGTKWILTGDIRCSKR
jgi:hypothetical protein